METGGTLTQQVAAKEDLPGVVRSRHICKIVYDRQKIIQRERFILEPQDIGCSWGMAEAGDLRRPRELCAFVLKAVVGRR